MTDTQKTPDEIKAEIEKEKDRRHGIDYLLSTWVAVADKADTGVGVTLSIGGTLVTGTITGVGAYIDGTMDALEASGGDWTYLREQLHDAVPDQPEDLPEDPDDLSDEQLLELIKVSAAYVHLKDAKLITPMGIVPTSGSGVYWRARLDRIDGWCYGILNQN